MKAGISTASLFLRRDNKQALELFNRFAIDTTEVFLTTFSEYGKEYVSTLDRGRVEVNSIHVLNSQFEPQLFASHEKVKEDAYFWLKKVLAGAQMLGAKHYTFHGTARYKLASRNPLNDNFNKLRKDFSCIAKTCQEYGVTLCLENVEWATYNRVGVFEQITPYVPEMKGVLDIKQARLSGQDYRKYLQEMGQKLAYAHISDVDEQGKMCLPGKNGTFDFDELLRRLKDVGFNGALIIEAYEKDYQKEEELKESYEYINELIYKHNA